MSALRTGTIVEITLKGGLSARGEVVSYRQVGDRCEVAVLTDEGEHVSGVVFLPAEGPPGEIFVADNIAHAIIAGAPLRMPVQQQLHVLATAVLARGEKP